jgi:hypothetical protein
MGNSVQVLAKIARDAAQIGLTVNSQTNTAVVINNGSNDLTVSYVDASIDAPMGGVSSSSSPYLGIGTGNPGKIKITSAIHTAGTIADVLDSITAAKVFALCAGFANTITLSNDDASYTGDVAGHPDLIGLGQ